LRIWRKIAGGSGDLIHVGDPFHTIMIAGSVIGSRVQRSSRE
jgi:hypothetical protein